MQSDNAFNANKANFLFFKLAIEFPKNTSINKLTIKLINGKQLSYMSIYVFSLEVETLKIYIKPRQKTKFIWLFTFFAKVLYDLIRSYIANFACISIFKAAIISSSRINSHFFRSNSKLSD